MSQKFTSTIAGASIFISIVGLLSRGLGFIREMIFANNFGLETEFDLYLVGAVLPITINTVLLYIGQNFFIPEFQKINSSDAEAAQKYFKQSFITFVAAGALISLLLFFTGDLIINIYMQSASQASREIATKVFNIFLLTIPFSAGVAILSALLQTVYEFKYPAVSLLFLNISIIVLLLFFSDRFGVYIIPAGYTLGSLLQFGYLLFKSKKFVKLNLLTGTEGFSLSKSILSSSIVIIIMIESISQLYSIFDRFFYGEISSGGIASLNYAMIIWFLPVSIFSISLATVVFPTITKAIIESSFDEIEKIYNESISMNTFIFIPLTFIMFFYGDTLIRIFFERGKFSEESTAITFGVLRFYALSLAFYSVYAVFNKIFYSIGKAKLLLVITITGLLLKLFLNFVLVDLQQEGLALSTCISFIFFFLASYIVLNTKLKIKDRSLFIKDFIFHLTNCTICLISIKIISDINEVSNIFEEVLVIAFFMLIYLFNLILIKHNALVISNRIFKRLNLNKLFSAG
ncbi:MAG: MATE family efflux transporter [Ignavibacteriaceae bacterium]|nr:MATE family efflux transporter [Ignavibacteriaceae bacterium]